MTRTRKKKRRDNRCPDCINGKCDYCLSGNDRRDNRRIWVIDKDAEPIFLALTKALGYVPKRKPR